MKINSNNYSTQAFNGYKNLVISKLTTKDGKIDVIHLTCELDDVGSKDLSDLMKLRSHGLFNTYCGYKRTPLSSLCIEFFDDNEKKARKSLKNTLLYPNIFSIFVDKMKMPMDGAICKSNSNTCLNFDEQICSSQLTYLWRIFLYHKYPDEFGVGGAYNWLTGLEKELHGCKNLLSGILRRICSSDKLCTDNNLSHVQDISKDLLIKYINRHCDPQRFLLVQKPSSRKNVIKKQAAEMSEYLKIDQEAANDIKNYIREMQRIDAERATQFNKKIGVRILKKAKIGLNSIKSAASFLSKRVADSMKHYFK